MSIFDGGSKEASKQLQGGIRIGEIRATNQLNQGLDKYTQGAQAALGEYAPYAPQAQQAYGLYGDTLGLGGAAGNANALATYQQSPAYQFQMDQGLQALQRSASAQGLLGSGNTSADILGYSQGLANQNFSSWQDRLNGLGTEGLGIANQRAQIQRGIGQAGYDTSNSLADLAWNAETGIGKAKADQAVAESQGVLGSIMGGLSLGTKLLGGFM